jgi:hypothetical protein
MFSVGVRYCGGCDPRIDRSRIIRDLRAQLEKIGIAADFTTDKERPVDVVLLVNGCMHACLEGEYPDSAHNPQLICVRGEMVDDEYIEEALIPELLSKRISALLANGMPSSVACKTESFDRNGKRG